MTKEGERAGRAQDKEEANAMQKLRALGYMAFLGIIFVFNFLLTNHIAY